MSVDVPYFMTNDAWYKYEEGACEKYGSNYVLTEEGKANPKVLQSWRDFVQNDSIFERDIENEPDPEEEDEAMDVMGIKG